MKWIALGTFYRTLLYKIPSHTMVFQFKFITQLNTLIRPNISIPQWCGFSVRHCILMVYNMSSGLEIILSEWMKRDGTLTRHATGWIRCIMQGFWCITLTEQSFRDVLLFGKLNEPEIDFFIKEFWIEFIRLCQYSYCCFINNILNVQILKSYQ